MITFSRFLYVLALVLFVIAAVLCFLTDTTPLLHILGVACAGFACLATAPLVP